MPPQHRRLYRPRRRGFKDVARGASSGSGPAARRSSSSPCPCDPRLARAPGRARTSPERIAWGVRISTPTGVERGGVALHTATGLRRRRRKGLEPSRRLSETTGPLHLSVFRVVVPTTEVTKCGARCKSTAAVFTHRAPGPVRGPVRYRSARAPPHMFRRSAGRRAHVPAAQGRSVKAPVFKAMVLRSPVTASAGEDSAHVTAASAARVRCTEGAAADGSTNGAAGSPRIASGAGSAKHAVGCGDGSACMEAGSSVGTPADDSADAGRRRSRHRRGSGCKGGEPRRRPMPAQPARTSEAEAAASAARSAGASTSPRIRVRGSLRAAGSTGLPVRRRPRRRTGS